MHLRLYTAARLARAFPLRPIVMTISRLAVVVLLVLAGGLSATGPVSGQQFPDLGSLEARAGLYLPQDAETGYGFSVDVDLGYLSSPIIRAIAGFNYFAADVDRELPGQSVTGSITAAGVRAGVRLDPFGAGAFTPYLAALLTGHSVTTDPDDEIDAGILDELYGDFVVGAGLGAGLTWSLDERDRYALTAEGRRVFATDVGHWAAEAGVRITPRGRGAYTERPRPVAVPPVRPVTEASDRERAAAERAAEQARREREEADQATREAREEGRRAAAEAGRLREEADTLALAREREAAARAAAERAAEQARQQAEAAGEAAREAEQRAAAAERRAYDALLDLDRLITTITEVRETERGLAVVLGQGLFASGQAALSSRARDEVGRIAAVLQQFPDRTIAVEGHTDAVGGEVANQRLSEQRAEAVRAALIASGIEPVRIQAAGYGESRPIGGNDSAKGRAQNRRVEIIVIGARRPGE